MAIAIPKVCSKWHMYWPLEARLEQLLCQTCKGRRATPVYDYTETNCGLREFITTKTKVDSQQCQLNSAQLLTQLSYVKCEHAAAFVNHVCVCVCVFFFNTSAYYDSSTFTSLGIRNWLLQMQHYYNCSTVSVSVVICGLFDQIYTFWCDTSPVLYPQLN